jgi:hypothetical protein
VLNPKEYYVIYAVADVKEEEMETALMNVQNEYIILFFY